MKRRPSLQVLSQGAGGNGTPRAMSTAHPLLGLLNPLSSAKQTEVTC